MTLSRIALAGLFLYLAPCAAVRADECFPNTEKYDVCAAARKIQEHIGPTLPMRVSSEMTITTIFATGPRLIMTATWQLTEAQFNEQLVAHKLTAAQFETKMRGFTQRLVCGQKVAAAFLSLGGEMQYTYLTIDGASTAERKRGTHFIAPPAPARGFPA
jgi:hypothetical protein